MQRTAVINVVGLTESLIGKHTPRISAFREQGGARPIIPAFPAVTCTAQSTYLTGTPPSRHGIVGNGWYNRELAEVQFWKQSNHLVHGRKLWEDLRAQDQKFTCAKLFWWYNMYSSADYSITPRPMYPADGRKVFDIYASPFSIRTEIKKDLGEFPFAAFWGPAAGIRTPQSAPDAASRWIAESAKWIENKYQPTLSLIYLPHLDYNLQRCGPSVAAEVTRRMAGVETASSPGPSPPQEEKEIPLPPSRLSNVEHPASSVASPAINPAIIPDLQAIDAVVGDLIGFLTSRSIQVLLLSEYGITSVGQPIHLNRLFRAQGWLAIKDEIGLEQLDCGASKAFAVADHQIAHIYLNEPTLEHKVRGLLEKEGGIEQVIGSAEKKSLGADHPRSGDLIAIAKEDAWFTYYYWLDDSVAPDFARTVDIHRKPGYDPVELFLDPKLTFPKLRIAKRLLQKKAGLRMLMDVIPLDASLVKGSHGRRPAASSDFPVFISPRTDLMPSGPLEAAQVKDLLKRHILAP